MTAKMWELQAGQGHVGFDVRPPLFKPNLTLAFGIPSTYPDGAVEADYYNSGQIAWGFADIFKQQAATTFAYSSDPVEETASALDGPPAVGNQYYQQIGGATSVFTGSQGIDVYDCGGVDITSGIPAGVYNLMLLSGNTLVSNSGQIDATLGGGVSVTGVGFQPDLILVMSAAKPFNQGPYPSWGQVGGFCFGAADASLNQWAVSTKGSGYIVGGGGDRTSRITDSYCGLTISHNGPLAVIASFSLTSMDADGFTINVDNPTDNLFYFIAIADPGGHFKVGTGTAGDASLATGGLSEALLFGSVGATSFDADTPSPVIAMGAATMLDGRERSGWASALPSGWHFEACSQYKDEAAISLALAAGSRATVNDDTAHIAAWNPTTVDLNWTAGGGSGIKFGWVSIATSSSAGYAGCGYLPQIYRWLKK